MASTLVLKFTHLSLVLLVVTISVFLVEPYPVEETCTIEGYVRDPLYPFPNGNIIDTFYITNRPNRYSKIVAIWDLWLSPLPSDQLSISPTRALLWGVMSPKMASDGFGDYKNDMIAPFLAVGPWNSSSKVNYLGVESLGNQLVTGTISFTRLKYPRNVLQVCAKVSPNNQ